MAKTGTYIDEHGRRRKLTPEMRDSMADGLDAAARALAARQGEVVDNVNVSERE